MSVTLITNVSIASQSGISIGSVLISGDTIGQILAPGDTPSVNPDVTIDGTDSILFPGIIDDHVHFRDPGLTHKATIATESRAAVAGGVTTVFDMPNCIPQSVTINTLRDKCATAKNDSLCNYSFYLGATRDNLSQIEHLDPAEFCGIKLFMGSSTGGMLIDDDSHIYNIFRAAPTPVAVHCEDSSIIARNMEYYSSFCNGEPPVRFHPLIRSAEACYASSAKAIEIAEKAGARLHILHITTGRELSLLTPGGIDTKQITAEVCPSHLMFSDADYGRLGTRIKCNPAVKSPRDRDALRKAIATGLIDVVGTDHAPHLLSEKQGGCRTAASGMPVLPYSLPAMLELADKGVITIPDIVRTMCHNPAVLFKIRQRGFIRKGYKADLTLVSKSPSPAPVSDESLPNKCRWSPFSGHTFEWQVTHTWVNGHQVYRNGQFNQEQKGEKVEFDR